MRIAIFAETFLPKWDGITNTLCHLLEYLMQHGHDTLMFAPAGAPASYAATPIIGLPALPFPLYPELKLVRPGIQLTRRLGEFRPDLVHVVNPVTLGPAGLRAAHNLGVPSASSYHTDVPGYARRYRCGAFTGVIWAYFRWLHNQSDVTLCPSRFTASQLAQHGFQRLKVWGRGVDTYRFDPAHRTETWRKRLGAADHETPLLLYAGRLAVEKRVEWLRPLLDALPQARLAIVGDGPLRSKLKSYFAGTRTGFTGYLSGADLAAAYAAADVFVFPSATETCGNVVLEALASGLPAVVPSSGGVTDHICHGQNGLQFDPQSSASFVAQVRSLIDDADYRRRLGAGGRAYARARSWGRVFDELLADWTALMPTDASGAHEPIAWPGLAGRVYDNHVYQESWQL